MYKTWSYVLFHQKSNMQVFGLKKIYVKDTEHLHHVLVALGLPPHIVDWVFYVLSFLFATVAVGFVSGDRRLMIGFIVVLMLAFLVLAVKLAALGKRKESG